MEEDSIDKGQIQFLTSYMDGYCIVKTVYYIQQERGISEYATISYKWDWNDENNEGDMIEISHRNTKDEAVECHFDIVKKLLNEEE